jgi:hypothetical protein
MKKLLTLTQFSLLALRCLSQNNEVNELAISQSFIWNNTTVYDAYSGARATNKSGTSVSSGINLNYSKTLYKNFYAKIGIGYFKQKFGIHRGFDFEQPNVVTGLFYTTKYYAYRSLNYWGGIGYNKLFMRNHGKILPKNSGFRVLVVYNFYATYKQEFKHDFDGNLFGNPNPQIRKENYSLGNSLGLQAGFNRPLFKKVGIGIDLLLPIYNKWRKDRIFRENINEFYGSNFSIGTSLNLIYNFKNKK